MRRSCFLEPTLGEGEILIDNQFCGGYVDPITLRDIGYITLANTTSRTIKGYICPLGQICKVRKFHEAIVRILTENAQETVNPKNNIESFDAIHNSALQVFIISTANGVRFSIAFLSYCLTRDAVDTVDVFDDRLRVLRFVLLLHFHHHRPELLAHQSVRRCDH